MSCLYILETKPLSVASFANIFSPSVACLFFFVLFCGFVFIYLYCSFLCCAKAFEFWLDPICLFLFLFLLSWDTNFGMIYVREWFAYALFRSFMVSCLMFKSLRLFEFIFVHWMRMVLTALIYICCWTFPTPLAEEIVFFPFYILTFVIEDWPAINVWVYFWLFVSLIHMSVLVSLTLF